MKICGSHKCSDFRHIRAWQSAEVKMIRELCDVTDRFVCSGD